MKNKDQKMRYSNEELALMKANFADDTEKLYIIRKVLLQFPLTDQEQTALNSFMTEQLYTLLHKTFLPNPDPDAPLGQITHLNLALGADIKGLSPDGAWPFLKAKELEIHYLTQQMKALRGTVGVTIVLSDLTDLSMPKTQREQAWVNVAAWNWIYSFVDTCVNQLQFLAGLKEESVEETMLRLQKNSAK